MVWYVFVAAFLCLATSPRDLGVAGQSYDLPPSFRYHSDNGFSTGSTASASEAPSSADGMDVYRLPTDVYPVSYSLEVSTDFGNLTYAGRVEIAVGVVRGTCLVTLNARDLRVNAVEVVDRRLNESLPVLDHYPVTNNEQYVIALNDTRCLIPHRPYVVKVAFEAPLRDDMSGYYKSSYKENNVTKWLAVTKFEPTHARKAFPCFDEPALKAPFNVSIKRRSDQISLSNMPLLRSTKIQRTNMYWDYFQETPPISTYLVAFFVGEFYSMKTQTIGIYTHKSYVRQAEYITSKSPKLLEAMENFTGVDYMMPKLDLLAIPDFAAGAMENWGLNTYRERLLLLSKNSQTKMKEFATTVVQHELSHQWFGDFVTCAWWDYLWLNEGFATFFEYFATKTVEPDWRLEDVFVHEIHQSALESDQTPMHPISGSVKTPAQIKTMFDKISYDKAAAVLRMLQYTVTEDNFKNALKLYLEDNENKAVTPDELWTAFEYVLYDADFNLGKNISVTKYMKSWTEQAGYPLIKISTTNNSYVITQERFLTNSSKETDKTEWIVGLTYTTEHEKNFNGVLPKVWLQGIKTILPRVWSEGNKTVLPDKNQTGWYIFNLQSIGFYRVNYEEDNWDALIHQLHNDYKAIHVLNRAQLIDDAFNLARAKKVNYTLPLKLSVYLVNEKDAIPWYSARNGFTFLLNRMRRCSCGYKDLKKYVTYLAGTIYANTENLVVNRNNTEHTTMTSWNSFSQWACKLDNEFCIKSASSYFTRWRQGKKIPADIKDAAFCVGIKNGDSEVWNSVLDVYVNSESASDRYSAQKALACSKDPVQLSKYLDFMFKGYDGPIRPQDFRVIYQTLATTPEGISALIHFLTEKFDRIVREILNGEQVATSIYSLLASSVASNEEILKIDSLRNNASLPVDLRKKFNSSYVQVEDNLAWFKTNHAKVHGWTKAVIHELGLDEYTPVDSSTVTPVTSSEDTPRSSSSSLNVPSLTFILSALLINSYFFQTKNSK